ncbi:hypothetical protein DTW90_16545 [Neorhizobium sp. P12A]|uniref:hypothetical protein n=1 Tax=Rhizobium/Agrobacterium group TaxID=227290 RepID=UPI0010511B85|nr:MULTISPECIES: hypothetical protein [Rhizobium/Agrobacterium group]KAA0697761.1 hypothetical protein DTW90_16545 [Neorhizobium sp. P12A]TCR88041.1 hypothetical protein EV561_105388 [Rhizobium sp. BK376]
MKAISTLNWDKIRNWLAEAGSVCGGFYVDYQELRGSRPKLLPRRRFDQPGRAAKADAATGWVVSNSDL